MDGKPIWNPKVSKLTVVIDGQEYIPKQFNTITSSSSDSMEDNNNNNNMTQEYIEEEEEDNKVIQPQKQSPLKGKDEIVSEDLPIANNKKRKIAFQSSQSMDSINKSKMVRHGTVLLDELQAFQSSGLLFSSDDERDVFNPKLVFL
jgi:hypothetical protein